MIANPEEYDVVFSLAEGSYQPPLFVVVWMTVFGIVCLVAIATRRGMQQMLAGGALAAGMAFGAFSLFEHHQDYVRMRAQLQNGQAIALEGVVRYFQADSSIGNGSQKFTITGREFIVSSNSVTPGFTRTAGTGGPDLTGKCVRVVFVNEGVRRDIVWLGIRRSGCAET
jgi:hypothetical protein